MITGRRRCLTALFTTLTCCLTVCSRDARADVRLPAVYGSHMVLQRDVPLPVRGWANAGEEVTVTLGDNSEAVLIPNGSFYQETGGNWIFVVSPDGSEAVKRNVRLGRRNTEFIEVLDGLEPGERVITSPYTSYAGMDRLTLN